MTKNRSELLLLATSLIILSVIVAFQAVDSKPLFREKLPTVVNSSNQETTVRNKSQNAQEQDKSNDDDFPINLNTATVDQLCTVSGIGAVKAQAILDYRQAVGGFLSVEELLNVKGIGDATFNKIKGAFVV